MKQNIINNLKYIKNIFLFLWQLPQNIIGIIWLVINLIINGIYFKQIINDNIYVYKIPINIGSISLGNYIICCETANELTIKHEYGHCIQSMYLGPLYLIIIGIPSIIWASCYKYFNKSYYWFYTEKLADKLAKINRE